jgi:hypothetical protein
MANNDNILDEPRSRIGDDLLFGAQAIADELHGREGEPASDKEVRKTYYLLERGLVPGQKVGKIWTSSKRRLRQHFGCE